MTTTARSAGVFPGDSPPKYHPGLEVTKTNTTNLSPITIQVRYINTSQTFNLGDDILGTVTITPFADIHFDRVLIALQQQETVTPNSSGSTLTKIVTLQRYNVPPEAMPEDNVLLKGYKYTFPYSLQVPRLLPDAACDYGLDLHRHITPSVGSPFEWSDQTPDIPGKKLVTTHKVHVSVVSADQAKPLLESTKYLKFVPSYPPLHLEPQPCISTLKLKSGSLFKRAPAEQDVTVFVQSQPTLSIDHNQKTIVPLEVKFRTTDPSPRFPKFENATYTLIAHSLQTMGCPGYYPKPGDPNVHAQTMNFTPKAIKIAGQDPWQLKSVNDREGYSEYYTKVYIAMVLPVKNKARIVPSYFSCMSSRHYEAKLSVHFAGYGSNAVLKFPISIAGDTSTNGLAFWAEMADETDPVPPYRAEDYQPRYVHLGMENNIPTNQRYHWK
ncbi:hypothetical protein TRVA0_026S01288 [Trichomonascus vanleenenianus]|uniref:uncharacterized protein n=1 Tax=Trichomonascus vanleenenianus TaxID=2268995 RepID=UPI003ECB53AD